MNEPVAVAVLAKAPVAGFAKTRLIPVLGPHGAAVLHARLLERAVTSACAAAVGPVTLWATPDERHPVFQSIAAQLGIKLARQGEGDLGARMLTAVAAAKSPALVIGADCPVLTPHHLRVAAHILRAGDDAVVIPAEDGGYALIGLRRPERALFADMPWSTPVVMAETRRRFRELGLTWQEPVTLWDVDRPQDLQRLREIGLDQLIPIPSTDQSR
jgi:rSAM/selenodomain-associated transferase 1